MQVIWIKWLLFLHQRPGNNEHLGGQFNSHFSFNAALTLSTAQHIGEVSAKVRVVHRGNKGGLLQAIAKLFVPCFRYNRHRIVTAFAAAIGTQIIAGEFHHLVAAFKAQRIGDSGQNHRDHIGPKARDAQ